METELITIAEYCTYSKVDPSFIIALEQSGLITFTIIGNDKFIHHEQLMEMERLIHFHYDLDINVEGIDAIINLLVKIKKMQQEIQELNTRLHLYTDYNHLPADNE